MMTTPKFPLGSLVATPAALEPLERAGQSPAGFLTRHAAGDWGEVDATDGKLKDAAAKAGERILSVYETKASERIWVITEADRSSTCILLPEEY
jgi:hypothetical protein